jgi:hypothetical protein
MAPLCDRRHRFPPEIIRRAIRRAHSAASSLGAQHHRPRISWRSVGFNSEVVRRVSVPDCLASIHSGAAETIQNSFIFLPVGRADRFRRNR